MTIIVAGSGPAGIFAALGALEKGAKVIMVDPGLEADAEAQAFSSLLGGRLPSQWTSSQRSALKATHDFSKQVWRISAFLAIILLRARCRMK